MSTEVSRRVTLAWVAAASAGPWAVVQSEPAEAQTVAASLWQDVAVTPITGPGYGQDPNLMKPSVPWPLTLTPDQRAVLRIAAGLILPADAHSPSGAGLYLDAFVDEWVSAPYPQQQRDRIVILSGLAWLDAESTTRFGKNFAQANDTERCAIFDSIAFKAKVQPGYERPAFFFARLRGLLMGGFYSLPEGMKDIGYIGNTPMAGDYSGPTPEAVAHLDAALAKLGIKTA
ncbi:MAG TPA: gluconate 2-dehydrogenase subunit 3 family protein [Rhizomicrobium sp.]|nr:gluconate 2-dehydrogenase subunit 3 family protein [Rhizomicrobium sp.]